MPMINDSQRAYVISIKLHQSRLLNVKTMLCSHSLRNGFFSKMEKDVLKDIILMIIPKGYNQDDIFSEISLFNQYSVPTKEISHRRQQEIFSNIALCTPFSASMKSAVLNDYKSAIT